MSVEIVENLKYNKILNHIDATSIKKKNSIRNTKSKCLLKVAKNRGHYSKHFFLTQSKVIRKKKPLLSYKFRRINKKLTLKDLLSSKPENKALDLIETIENIEKKTAVIDENIKKSVSTSLSKHFISKHIRFSNHLNRQNESTRCVLKIRKNRSHYSNHFFLTMPKVIRIKKINKTKEKAKPKGLVLSKELVEINESQKKIKRNATRGSKYDWLIDHFNDKNKTTLNELHEIAPDLSVEKPIEIPKINKIVKNGQFDSKLYWKRKKDAEKLALELLDFKKRRENNKEEEIIDDSSYESGLAEFQKLIKNHSRIQTESSASRKYSIKRSIIIDGSNIAMAHGIANFKNKCFSCKGIKLAVQHFVNKGHKYIKVILPRFKRGNTDPNCPTINSDILDELEESNLITYTPTRIINGKLETSFDSIFLLKSALNIDAFLVSNNQFIEFQEEYAEWKRIIQENILQFSFYKDMFIVSDASIGSRNEKKVENYQI